MPATRRPQTPRRSPRPRSDLLSRVLVAVPAAIVAIVFVDVGGLAFTLFMIAVGCICLHELYRMLARWRPMAIAGFLALAGMALAAHFGTLRSVTGVGLASLPVLFVFVLVRGRSGGSTITIAGT